LENIGTDEITLLQNLNLIAKVYLIFECKSDQQENIIRARVCEKLPFLQSKSHFILFHETNKGKIAFIRQLKPKIHCETDPTVAMELKPHISHVFLLGKTGPNIPSIRHLNDLYNITIKPIS
jgi:hypothetical protein